MYAKIYYFGIVHYIAQCVADVLTIVPALKKCGVKQIKFDEEIHIPHIEKFSRFENQV